jgi:hypothetical protein
METLRGVVFMREKHTLVDKENRLRGTERERWVLRDPYPSRFMKRFERRHGVCTVST